MTEVKTSVSLLDQLLAPGGLTVLFQPIFALTGEAPRRHALECQVRGPVGTNFEDSSVLYEYARHKRAESLIDRASIVTALQTVAALLPLNQWTIHLHATTIGSDQNFTQFLLSHAELNRISPSRLVVEIAEQGAPRDQVIFSNTLEQLRANGVRIALGSFGKSANYHLLLDCQPDFINLDRYLVSNAGHDQRRRVILNSLARLAEQFEAEVIADGVENKADLKALIEAGIRLGQGSLLSHPLPADALSAFVMKAEAAEAMTQSVI